MAPGLAGISKTPFWLLIFVVQLFPMGGIAAIALLFGDSPCDGTSASSNILSFNEKVYVLAGALFLTALLVTVVCHCVVSLRVHGLATMMQQDPLIIAGDPACLLKLSCIPWYGVTEVDQLQLAIVQTYNAYALDPKNSAQHSRSGRVSHADDVEKVEWLSAASDTDGIDGEASQSQAVRAYLRSQETLAATRVYVAPLLGTRRSQSPQMRSTSNPRESSEPGSAKSRGSSFVSRFFTPRSYRENSVVYASSPIATSGVAAPVYGRGRKGSMPPAGGVVPDRDGFYSIPSSLTDKASFLADQSGPRSGLASRMTAESGMTTPFIEGSLQHFASRPHSTAVPIYQAVVNPANAESLSLFGSGAGGGPAAASAGSTALYDPLGDNDVPWDVLQKGLKLQSSIFVQLISSLRVGQSLSAVTLPVHILESRSLLEMLTDTFVHWELLMPIATNSVAPREDRIAIMFRWFMSAYHVKPKGAKKPYNPILGEVFRCCFIDPTIAHSSNATTFGGSMEVLAEQVSHHPPVSAVHGRYRDLIRVSIVYAPKSKFVGLNCAASIGEGGIMVSFPKAGLEYKISFPSAYVSGIIAGTPTLELGGTVTITDLQSSDLRCEVQFLRKGWISGSLDQMHAVIIQSGVKDPIRQYSGTWHGKIFDGPPQKGGDKKPAAGTPARSVFLDPFQLGLRRPMSKLLVSSSANAANAPTSPSSSTDKISRVVWKDLTRALRQGSADAAAAAKHHVETVQRAERKQLAAEGRAHQNRFFRFVGKHREGHDNAAMTVLENWEFTGREVLADDVFPPNA